MAEKVLYSTILQNFARPLLNSKDTDEEFMAKMKVIEMIWNYSVAKKFRMPVFKELQKIITEQKRKYIETKEVFDMFLELKRTQFKQYNNYIIKIELRERSDGKKMFFVESIHPDKILKKVK